MKVLFLIMFLSLIAHAQETQYSVKGGLKRGEKTTLLHVELETFNSARVNAEAPISLELKSVDATELLKSQFYRKDFIALNSNKLRLETESKGHSQKIEAHIVFYLCFKSSCKKIDHHFMIGA